MNELTKPIKGKKQKVEPMHEWVYLSIMGEYLICPDEFLENPRIRDIKKNKFINTIQTISKKTK